MPGSAAVRGIMVHIANLMSQITRLSFSSRDFARGYGFVMVYKKR
jgi:hypothetical protein